MNRIAKIDTCGNNHARLFDADGAQIGGLDAWASCAAEPDDSGDTYLAEIVRRWPSSEPAAPAILPNGLPPVGWRGFLRNGWPARVIANDLVGSEPLVVVYEDRERDCEAVGTRFANGRYPDIVESQFDLILPPRVSDATVEAGKNVVSRHDTYWRNLAETIIAHHEAEQEGRA